jgi:hypothetical protein
LRLSIIFTLAFIFSCSNSSDEKVRKAIDIAQTHLSFNRCDEAIAALADVGPKPGNAIYTQVLASAHACRGGFSEINFLLDDLGNIQTADFSSILRSLATLSLSNETTADSSNYIHLRSAISHLRVPASNPTHNGRVASFGNRKAGDLSVQQLFLSLTQLGKFLNYYGSVNNDGDKGQRAPNNNCFLTYTDPAVNVFIFNNPDTGSCTGSPTGHPDLAFNLSTTRRRLCEGIVLFNNVIDILESIDFSTIDPLQDLATLGNTIDVFKSQITDPGILALLGITTQSACEAYAVNNFVDIQRFFGFIVEVGLQ